MIKMVGLLNRLPGLGVDEFREYYETKHRLIGEKYLQGYACKYMRRYPQSRPERGSGKVFEPDFDVMLEIWYPDQQSYEACNQHLAEPDIAAEIAADEEQLFDRSQMRFYLLHEEVSDID